MLCALRRFVNRFEPDHKTDAQYLRSGLQLLIDEFTDDDATYAVLHDLENAKEVSTR